MSKSGAKRQGMYGQGAGRFIDMSEYMVRWKDCGKREKLVTWKCLWVKELTGY